MAKRRTYKRDRRGRFASGSGGSSGGGLFARARGALRERRNNRLEKRAAQLERNRIRIDKDLGTTNTGKRRSPSALARAQAKNNAFHRGEIKRVRAKKR